MSHACRCAHSGVVPHNVLLIDPTAATCPLPGPLTRCSPFWPLVICAATLHPRFSCSDILP